VERVAAVLDANVEQVQRQDRDVGVPVVYVADDSISGFARGRPLLGVDEVGDLEA
jgi:hypothetical protein